MLKLKNPMLQSLAEKLLTEEELRNNYIVNPFSGMTAGIAHSPNNLKCMAETIENISAKLERLKTLYLLSQVAEQLGLLGMDSSLFQEEED